MVIASRRGGGDEELDALFEPRCECGGEIEHQRTEYQYQDELPEPRPVRRRFVVHIGKCRCCGRRHQGRHPFQTSDALGAAGCMLGPRAVALVTELNKELGLSPQKTAKALERFGIRVSAGGVVRAIARQARALEPTYRALIEGVRWSPTVAPDETGWRINGQKVWLWAFAGDQVTVYLIARAAGTSTPPKSSARITRVCSSAMDGRRIGGSPTPSTKPAMRTCFAGLES
jgi:transposase